MAHRSRASIREEHANKDDRILGKPRWMWVEDACRALIATTLADGRWKMLREGFPKFQSWALSSFRNLGPIAFTPAEIREIWSGLEKYALTHDKKLWPAFERMYDTRHRWDKTKPVSIIDALDAEEEAEKAPPVHRSQRKDIAVEKIVDGSLRRVH